VPEGSFFARPALLLAGFAAVTVPWLVALVVALRGHVALLSGFVGQIDPSGYFYGMSWPGVDHLRLLAILAAAPIAVVVLATLHFCGRFAIGIVVGAIGGLVIAGIALSPPAARDPLLAAKWLLASIGAAWTTLRDTGPHPTDDLVLYLPTFAFWPAFALLVLHWRRAMHASDPPTAHGKPWRLALTRVSVDVHRLWFLSAGAALLLTQYPRMGYGHIVWSGGMLYAVGSDLLHRLARTLYGGVAQLGHSPVARAALGVSFALLPAAAAAPYLQERIDRLVDVYASLQAPPASDAALVPLAMPDGDHIVWAPAGEVRPIQQVVDTLRANTAPGEPIFAYPALPGFYYLADRPNATRFNHLFAGMASPDDELEMVQQLEQVRYVVWDEMDVYNWVRPEDNAPVMAYLAANFREKTVVWPYAILSRDGTGPPRPRPSA
jgi:hypothetical protein